MTTPTMNQDAVLVHGRVIPVDRLAGVVQITDLFNRLIDQMTLPEGAPRTIRRSHVSNWANRRETTGFPAPLDTPAFGGAYVWDIREFVDESDRLLWTGPPGRWARRQSEPADQPADQPER
jgi:hypothetical protein